jgi:glutathione S-transferase
MSKLKIHGTAFSRAGRALWAARETGVAFDLVEVDPHSGATKTPEFLAINPNGRIPAIDDDGTRLFESFAIVLYLAKKYGSGGPEPIYPSSVEDEGRVLQWSFWAVNEIDSNMNTVLYERRFKPEAERDPAAADAAAERLKAPLSVLDGVLAARKWLVGGRFTVADLNVAASVGAGAMVDFDFSPWPRVIEWLGRCNARPAAAG